MNTRSKAVAPNTTADMPTNVNAPHTPTEPTREDVIPTWARALIEKVEATNVSLQDLTISVQSLHNKCDQVDNTLKNLESPDELDSWEDSSPQIMIPKEPIIDHLDSSNFVPYNDHYLRDRTDYQHNEVGIDIPMFKEVDDPKEYFNVDITSSLPKTTQFKNPTPRANSIIRCYKCRKVGHVKANCSKLAIFMDDSNPLPTNDSKKFELEDEIYELDMQYPLSMFISFMTLF